VFFVALINAELEFAEHLPQGGAQGVIDRLREDVRPRGHQVGGDPEGWTRFESALDGHARLVDLQDLAQRCEAFFHQRGKGRDRLMMPMSEDEFHETARPSAPFADSTKIHTGI
jgi:hypothetical protein